MARGCCVIKQTVQPRIIIPLNLKSSSDTSRGDSNSFSAVYLRHFLFVLNRKYTRQGYSSPRSISGAKPAVPKFKNCRDRGEGRGGRGVDQSKDQSFTSKCSLSTNADVGLCTRELAIDQPHKSQMESKPKLIVYVQLRVTMKTILKCLPRLLEKKNESAI